MEKTRKHHSEAMKKWWSNPKNRKKQSLSHIGNYGYWKGKEIPQYAKEKMRKAKLGKYLGPLHPKWKGGKPRCVCCGKTLSHYGNKRCRKCYVEHNKGKNHCNWMGGISFEPYGKTFNKGLKEKIRKRDNYTCQECGHTEEQLGHSLLTHHIDYNKKNNNPQNLISLCCSCHTKTNYNRDNWSKYYKNKIKKHVNKRKFSRRFRNSSS